jgi:RNA recognition motif-containing protein
LIYIYVIFLFLFKASAQSQAGGYEQQRTPYVNGFSSSSNHAQSQALSDTNLYIKNLPPEYSDKDLAALVEGYEFEKNKSRYNYYLLVVEELNQ